MASCVAALLELTSARTGVAEAEPAVPLTQEDIELYQIALWTSVVLVVLLVSVVYSLVYLDMGPDTGGLFSRFKQVRPDARRA